MGDEERIKLFRGRMRVTVCVVSECVLFACRINFSKWEMTRQYVIVYEY